MMFINQKTYCHEQTKKATHKKLGRPADNLLERPGATNKREARRQRFEEISKNGLALTALIRTILGTIYFLSTP